MPDRLECDKYGLCCKYTAAGNDIMNECAGGWLRHTAIIGRAMCQPCQNGVQVLQMTIHFQLKRVNHRNTTLPTNCIIFSTAVAIENILDIMYDKNA